MRCQIHSCALPFRWVDGSLTGHPAVSHSQCRRADARGYLACISSTRWRPTDRGVARIPRPLYPQWRPICGVCQRREQVSPPGGADSVGRRAVRSMPRWPRPRQVAQSDAPVILRPLHSTRRGSPEAPRVPARGSDHGQCAGWVAAFHQTRRHSQLVWPSRAAGAHALTCCRLPAGGQRLNQQGSDYVDCPPPE